MAFLNNIPIIHDALLAENHRRWILIQNSKRTRQPTNLEFDSSCVRTSSNKVVRFRSFVGRIKIVLCRSMSSQSWPLPCFLILLIFSKVDQNARSGTDCRTILWKSMLYFVQSARSAVLSGNRYQAPSSGWDKRVRLARWDPWGAW